MTYTNAVAITLAEVWVMLWTWGLGLTFMMPNLEYMSEGRQIAFVLLSLGLILYIGYKRLRRRFARC